MADVVRHAHLEDHGILLEYQLPLTSRRLDCMVCGRDETAADRAVIVELKQWERCEETDSDDLVTTWLGGRERDVLHPSVQVQQYRRYLEDTHTAFYGEDGVVHLDACAYLHNYHADRQDPLFATRYRTALGEAPALLADDVDPLAAYLASRLARGEGLEVLRRVEQGAYRPSRKLLDHVGQVIKGLPTYVLLDEQRVVYARVRALAQSGLALGRKTALVVRGGPGTGKSVIALNLMSDLSLAGFNAHYVTGAKAFTETLHKIIGSRGAVQFRYFNGYRRAQPGAVDVLVCDEAHRIRETSNDRRTRKEDRSTRPQVDELLAACRVAVFFIDDQQVVRPNEIGSAAYLCEAAGKQGYDLLEYELEAQFRCAGSDGFVNWVGNTLGISRTANVLWEGDEAFEFRILPTPEALERL